MFLRRIIRLTVLVATLAAAGATYGFAAAPALTATATQPADHRVTYEVDESDPSRVAALRFQLAAPARGDMLATFDGGATWLECTAQGTALRCPTRGSDLQVQDAAGLALERAA